MATEYLTLEGTVNWAKVYDPDSYKDVDRRWILDFYPKDGGEWEKYRSSGIRVQVKNKGEGDYLTFRRSVEKKIKTSEGEKEIVFTPPVISGAVNVYYVNKEQPDRYLKSYEKGSISDVIRIGTPEPIGNGSKVKITLAVYNTQQGKGHRLESIEVLELEEYVASEGGGLLPEHQAMAEAEGLGVPVKEETDEEASKTKVPW